MNLHERRIRGAGGEYPRSNPHLCAIGVAIFAAYHLIKHVQRQERRLKLPQSPVRPTHQGQSYPHLFGGRRP